MNCGGLRKLGSLIALLLNGCLTTSCPDVGCAPPLTLELKAEQWVAGEYVVRITDSERSFECRFEKGAGDTAGVVERCDQLSGDRSLVRRSVLDDVTIDVMHTPKVVSVSVRRDGATLLDEKLKPAYVKSYPGGPDCGECLNASETLTLPDEDS